MKCTNQTCWNGSEQMCNNSSECNYQMCQCGEHSTCHAFLNQIISSPDRREITWRDAETYGDSEWISVEEMCEQLRKAPPIMSTLGYVLFENDIYIAVADTVGPEECSAITKIPKSMILSMHIFQTVEDNYETLD